MKKTLSSLTVAVIAAFAAQGAMAQSRFVAVPRRCQEGNRRCQQGWPDSGHGHRQCARRRRWRAVAEGEGRHARHHRATTRKTDHGRSQQGRRDSGHRCGQRARTHAAGQQSPKEKAATSTTTREDRKKTTAEANKAGTIPQTEAQMQSPKK